MEQEQEIAGHSYASQVGSYFLAGYYNVLANQPQLAIQFYTEHSSVVRLDCETGQWAFGETLEVINDMMMSTNINKVEVKTANFLESWGGAITLLVTGLVQLKGYPARKRFVQTILLAPKKDGYFVFSDIFKFICDEYDDQYQGADYSCADNTQQTDADNTQQMDAPYPMTETANGYFIGDGEHEEREIEAPAEDHEVHQQAPLEYSAGIYDDTPLEEQNPPFHSSTDIKQDSPRAPPLAPSPPITEEEPVDEGPMTYASVLRKKGNTAHQAIHSAPANKVTMGAAEPQQSVPVVEKSNYDTHRVASVPEDEEEFLSVYVGNLSPSTSVFDLEKVFKTFGRIKPDGVAIRSRKEAGVFFGFVEFEDHSGINNALDASPIELNGRFVHIEERRPNCGFPRGGRRGRGRDQVGVRYDEYATRSKGNGQQKRGGRQYDSYY